ncbi:winged helix DNA-binding domain-containing protein [Amnibacterium kyonggiense]|uniref:Winged helix DNA-binding protein n=1 Tax=Amnibacterium kyonggiense TaxID=595671 RepID=A0A4R7FRT4_9MICO|nr:winged helix DNA-binding domain-containing protein [Amnibacterium kyonggiense]TDS80545.1 winged helix DNA-binding protein [Amnibacterium kyonggiense]
MTAGPVAARCTAQLLSGAPATSAEAAVRRVLAVQGQDARGFRLAVRARTSGVTAADVDEALTGSRSLVVSWLNRGTLHLVAAEDFWWLHDLTTPQLATESLRRLAQEGVSPEQTERGIAAVVTAVAGAPRTRDELRAVLEAAGVPTAGQAVVHVLLAATLRHRLIRGPVRDGEHCMVLAEDWLGPAPAPLPRDEALALLAQRYLEGHGPSSDRDLAMWAKLPLRDVRTGLAAVETVEAGEGLVDLPGREPPAPLPTRLLGNFDPILHGWVSRDPVLGPHEPDVVTGGVFRSWAFSGGRAVALWRIAGGRVRIAPFAPLSKRAEAALLTDAAEVLAFLGLPAREPVLEPTS